ncbi:hypothetical protein BDN72DRAFT_964657 [Pluteus cervinus]|uniref:Uncharacterized protein n=1 Tax=Pluteus cervinus TaxID=181527 RepID=A0ACD3A9D6_9AGAR|nr:hypothetical protein BDN72DRAFT_964657 [Pluteus cervinus]
MEYIFGSPHCLEPNIPDANWAEGRCLDDTPLIQRAGIRKSIHSSLRAFYTHNLLDGSTIRHPNSKPAMLFLLTTALTVLQVQAAPATIPIVVHTLASGIPGRPDPDCSGTGANIRNLGTVALSCLITIGVCVYQAIHPDVPDPNVDSPRRKWSQRVWGAVVAVVAPEVMMLWAIKQRFGAGTLAKRVNEVVPSLRWERTQGHFAQMGGFASKDDRKMLLPETLIQLLEDGRLDIEELQSITKEDMRDKSRANWLSKALVALQTIWLLCECIARLQQKLPLLELELVSLGLAILNVFICILWWSKPLSVDRPIFLHVRSLSNTTTPSGPALDRTSSSNRSQATSESIKHESSPLDGTFATFKPMIDIFGQNSRAPEVAHGHTNSLSSGPGFSVFPIPARNSILPLLEVSSLIALIFAGVPFLFWDSTFPTRVELILWRIACIVIAVPPTFILLVTLSFRIYEGMSSRTSSYHGVRSFKFVSLCNTLVSISGSFYVFGRPLILVLSLIALRQVPPSALTNVPWTAYIPHL